MIKIIEDGMAFVMEPGEPPMSCNLCPAVNTCTPYSEIGHACNPKLICTSATPVQDEAKVYHVENRANALHLIDKEVEYWQHNQWNVGKLSEIKGYTSDISAFIIKGVVTASLIREIPPRSLTQAQIIESHPDLEGVELVGGWE